MPDGDAIHRSASALRTALAGTPMLRFDAPQLVGPVPEAGRVVERVESHGRHLDVEWDDGTILHSHLRMSGAWHVYHRGDQWRRPTSQMRAAIEVEDWIAVCFGASLVETYRIPDRRRHAAMGRPGPDLRRPDTDLAGVVNLLLAAPDENARIAEVLLDQRVMRGVGNVERCEVLWATELSPFARVGAIGEHDAVRVVNTAARMVRAHLSAPRSPSDAAVYWRNGQRCRRCGATVCSRAIGRRHRLVYWCPGCQLHLDPRIDRRADDTPMDPHPAAARFLADLPWNRETG